MDINTYIASGVIEQYVLGTLPEDEAAILECVIKNNTAVATAVIEMQETLEFLDKAQAVAPPQHLKNEIAKQLIFCNIENDIVKEEKLENAQQEIADDTKIITFPQRSPFKRFNYWAAAASILFLLSVGWNYNNNNNKEKELASALASNKELTINLEQKEAQNELLRNAKKINLKGVPKHPDMLADIYWDESKTIHLSLKNLPLPPKGKQYQLWAIVDSKPVDLGVYNSSAEGNEIQKMKQVTHAQAFAITLEKSGGSLTPTMEEMYVIGQVESES